MELLKNVLIKEVDGSKYGDKAFFVDNLPKSLLYTTGPKLVIDMNHPQQAEVPEYTIDIHGRKALTGAKTDVLLPGIEISQTGDGAYVFVTNSSQESRLRMADIDNYIKAQMPVLERIPQRMSISSQPGNMSAGPRPLSTLPRVVLPALVSPPAQAVQEPTLSGTIHEPQTKRVRKPFTEEQKAAARERLKKAREIQKAKKASQTA